VEAKAEETRKGVGRETDTTREIETEAGSVMHTRAGVAGLQTIETTRKTETMTSSVAETGTGIETGTVASAEKGSTS
jgi:hypothetical protein